MNVTMHLVQFIPRNIAYNIINTYSTFCLRNIIYFRNLEEETGDEATGDKKENIVEFQEMRRHYELLAATLITCWTKLSSDRIDVSDWDIFDDRADGIAIVSTVESVRQFLLKETKYILDQEVWSLVNDEVQYYDGFAHPSTFDTARTMFWKRKRYEKQREYRFAFVSSSERANIDTVIFSSHDPKAYIEKIYLGPKMADDDKRKLLARAIAADLAGVIENFDETFKKL